MPASAQALPAANTLPARPLRPSPQGPSRLWLCAHFPDLALEVLKLDPGLPAATLEETRGRPCLQAVSEGAKRSGVEAGMAMTAALALCPSLVLRPRQPAAEREALARLAEAGLAFTSWVSLDRPGSLLLEIGASLRLFGGAESLREQLRQRLEVLGHRPLLAVTPSAEASALLAECGLELMVEEPRDLRSVLGRVPVTALSLDDKTLRRLQGSGIRLLADLWRLPRDGLARRYGKPLLRTLDALSGSEVRAWRAFHRPPRFSARRDLPIALARLDHFFPAIAQLAAEFAAFLRARDAAALELALILLHTGRPATRLELRFRCGNRDAAHWLKLLREKLERSPLPAPLIAVELESGAIAPYEPERSGLFGDDPGGGRNWQAVLEQLQARLGAQSVRRLAAVDDHRPEHALRICATAHSHISTTKALIPTPFHEPPSVGESLGRDQAWQPPDRLGIARKAGSYSGSESVCSFATKQGTPRHVGWNERQRPIRPERIGSAVGRPPKGRNPGMDSSIPAPGRSSRPTEEGLSSNTWPLAARPLWLLPQPKPLSGHGLRLISEPERIESGWWDGAPVRRDYRVALDRQGRRLWVFRDLDNPGSWHLHGLFG